MPLFKSGAPARGRPASGGVVVSRPAVIVGGKGAPTVAPAKVRRRILDLVRAMVDEEPPPED